MLFRKAAEGQPQEGAFSPSSAGTCSVSPAEWPVSRDVPCGFSCGALAVCASDSS